MEQINPLPNQPIPPQMLTNPPVNSSSLNKPVLIVLLVMSFVVLSSLITYLLVKSQTPSQTPVVSPAPVVQTSPVPTPDPTVNWKTYTNNEFGFELNYPTNWTFTSEGPNGAMMDVKAGKQISGTVSPSYDTISFVDKDKNEQFQIAIFDPYKYPYPASVEEFVAGYLYTSGQCDVRWGFTPKSVTTINVGSLTFLKVKGASKSMIDQNAPSINGVCYYGKTLKGNLIVLGVIATPSKDDFSLFDQILSTFKFVGQETCNIGEEYINSAGAPITCMCPAGYEFKVTSTGWGPCPRPDMKDCPQTTQVCVSK